MLSGMLNGSDRRLKYKKKKKRNETKCRRPNMALHLSEFEDQKNGLKAHFWEANPVFGREREEKRGEELGLEEDKVLVGFLPIFLLLGDPAT